MTYGMIAIWASIFVITLVIELETADLTTIWFCISSLITLICSFFNLNPLYQVIIFVILSFVLILATRPLTKKMMNRDIIHTNSDKLIGMIAIVTKKIVDGEIGEVKVDNNLWRAISVDNDSINENEKVIINSLSGNKVIVSKIKSDNDVEIL